MQGSYGRVMNLEVAYIPEFKAAITGYKGYIGKSVCDFLVENNFKYEVVRLDNAKDVDVILHLAAKVDDNIECYKNNIALDLDVFEYCRLNNTHLLLVSGNNVYPFASDCNVSTVTSVNDFYSASKVHSEQLAGSIYGIDTTVLRVGDVFGYKQKHGNMFRAIENSINKSESLKLYGRGLKVRSYIYLKDLINIFNFFIMDSNYKKFNKSVFNISYAEPSSVYEIINYVAQHASLDISNIEMDISKEKVDFRTMEFSEIVGFKYEYDLWTALDDYIQLVKQK